MIGVFVASRPVRRTIYRVDCGCAQSRREKTPSGAGACWRSEIGGIQGTTAAQSLFAYYAFASSSPHGADTLFPVTTQARQGLRNNYRMASRLRNWKDCQRLYSNSCLTISMQSLRFTYDATPREDSPGTPDR